MAVTTQFKVVTYYKIGHMLPCFRLATAYLVGCVLEACRWGLEASPTATPTMSAGFLMCYVRFHGVD